MNCILDCGKHGLSPFFSQSLLSPLAVANTEKSFAPDFPVSMTDKRQRGFSLVAAIFLLVVIAALGTFAVTLSTTQQQSSALDVQGARAYQAARAGIEWGAYRILRNAATCAAVATTLPPLPGTLNGFTVVLTCNFSNPIEDGVNIPIFQLTSNANQGVGTPNFVERNISVTIAPSP